MRQFHNQLEVAREQLFRHPGLLGIFGVCTEKTETTGPAVLVEHFAGQRLNQLDKDVPLPLNMTRAVVALRVFQFLSFLAEPSPERRGSPYLICRCRVHFLFISQLFPC